MKRFFPIILIFFIIICVAIGVMLSNNVQPQPTIQTVTSPTPYLGTSFRGIDLNTATAGGIISIMGNPVRTDQGKNQKTLVYSSGVGNQPMNINVDAGNKVTSIIEPVQPGTKFGPIYASLGKEDIILYGNYYYSGYYLYTYLTLGTAVVANPKTDDVKQRWYFSPRDLTSFLQNVGVGFQTSPLPSGRE